MSDVSEKIDELPGEEYYEVYNMLIFMKTDWLKETNPELKERIDLAVQSIETAYDIHPNYDLHISAMDEDQDEGEDQNVDKQQWEGKEKDFSEYQEQDIFASGSIAGTSSAADPVYGELAELSPECDYYREVSVGLSPSDISLYPELICLSENEETKKSCDSGGTNYFRELATPPRVSDITDVDDDPDLYNAKGNKLSNEQKYREALACYTKAIMLNPKEPLYVYNRALVFMRMEVYILCIEDCKEAIRKDSKYSKAYITLSEAYFQMGDFGNAERECKEALNLEPDNDDYKRNLLLIQEKMKE